MARTETLTVVFTDLVGSTELMSRLGHDAYEAVATRVAEELGQPRVRWLIGFDHCWRDLLVGRIADAEARALEGVQLAQSIGEPDAMAVFGAQLFAIRYAQGRLDEFEARAVESVETPEAVPPAVRAAHALILCATGRRDEAARLLAQNFATGFGDLGYEMAWLGTMVLWAEVSAQTASRAAATFLYEQLAPWHAQVAFNGLTVNGGVAHYLGRLATVLEQYEAAGAHFGEAEEIHTRLQSPFWLALTQIGWAGMTLARHPSSDRARARERLERALAAARTYGFAGVERTALALLATCADS
jgi:tetratricopeptide (TPR) repeat protein